MSAETPSVRFGNLERALAKLEKFVAEDSGREVERAGILQAFEYTFELFWKGFQKVATSAGERASTPKAALRAALHMELIDDESAWLAMLVDRNLSVHTYNEALANEICERVRTRYAPAFRRARERLLRAEAP